MVPIQINKNTDYSTGQIVEHQSLEIGAFRKESSDSGFFSFMKSKA
jgi:hypothetical protein